MSVAYLEAWVGARRSGFRLDVGLTLEAGSRLAVIGVNGAGKSTLLETLAGYSRLTDGFIRLDGRELAAAPWPPHAGREPVAAAPDRSVGLPEAQSWPVPRREHRDRPTATVDGPARIGRGRWGRARASHLPPHRRGVVLLTAQPYLFGHLTVRANIEYGPRALGWSRAAASARSEELIARLGLADVADRPSRALSSGQAQRVAVARALAAEPKLLLLDEPFAALDVTAGELRQTTAALLGERGTTALVVSHNVLDVVALADRVLVLDRGQAVDEGPTEEVLGRATTAFVGEFVGVGVLPGHLAGGRFVTAAGWSCPAPPSDGSRDGPARLLVPPEAVTARRAGERLQPGWAGFRGAGCEGAIAPRAGGDPPGPGETPPLVGRLAELTTASSGVAATIVPDGGGPSLRLFLTLAAAWLPVGEPVELAIDDTKTRVIS